MKKKNKVFIIAEVGVNHNGQIKLAKKLIDVAKGSGADAVKFQSFKADKLSCSFAPKADYQKKTTSSKESQFKMLKKLELSHADHIKLIDYCRNKGILFLSSSFDADNIKYLDKLKVKMFKIPSGEITNYPLLLEASRKRKQIILSTGMSTLKEVQQALHVLTQKGNKKIVLLHCVTEYPAPYKDVNLNAMTTLRTRFNFDVGISDHTKGIEIAIAASALGAVVVEKHLTLDKNMKGPDHKASLTPREFKEMVCAIRNVSDALGNGIKKPTKSETKNIKVVRKSIVASRQIMKGEIFSEDNVTTKRPAGGIDPMLWNKIIGKRAKKKFKKDEFIKI